MIKKLGLVVLALLLAVPASAQLISGLVGFPVAARGPGLHGTQWVTDLTLYNPTDHDVNLFMAFLPANQDNEGDENLRPYHLEPHQTAVFEDVILSLFELDEDIKGVLTINTLQPLLNNPEGTVIHAVTRTYNTGGGDGTYGQTVPSLFPSFNVGWASSFLTGARNDDAFRSNLGVCGMALNEQLEVHYRITSADGTVIVEDSKVLHTLSMSQWSFEQLGVGNVDGPLSVELWLEPEQGSEDPCAVYPFASGFFAYISKVDNLTGDAEFIYAYPMSPYLCAAE